MSHFYGILQGGRGEATRCGTKKSGLAVKAMSWAGCVRVELEHDEKTGKDTFRVEQNPHQSNGAGVWEVIATGAIGQPAKKENADLNGTRLQAAIHALKEAEAELFRLHENQSGIEEEDLTDIARVDEGVMVLVQDAIKKAEV